MTSVAPPPPPPPPVGNGNAAQLTVTLSQQASVQLSKVALDSLISGLVKLPAGGQGEAILQSNLGPLPFKAPFVLPENAQATFKLIQNSPVAQLLLTHINGKAVPPNTPASRVATIANQFMQNGMSNTLNAGKTGQLNTGVVSNAATPATLLNLNSATGMKAFVLQITGQNQPQAQTSGQQSTQGQAAVLNQVQQTSKPTTTGPQILNSTVIKPAGTRAQANTAQQQASSNFFQKGNQLNVRLVSVQQPGQAIPTTATMTPPAVSSSTVITQGAVQGQTAAGQPIIKVPQGQIALDTTAKFPEGTTVKLEVLSAIRPSDKPVVSATAQTAAQTGALAQKWPALEEALTHLRETNPVIADQFTNAILPKPDARLAFSMIFFLKALGRGNFKNWANEQALRAIAKSKPELLKKLEGDFSNLSDKAKAPNSTDWKIAYIPLQDQSKLDQIRIAQRDHKEEEKDGKEDPGVRFVIDINLSKLGPMQFDGLAKERARSFDLIIRTHSALPGFMRKDIHDIYAHGMDAVGFDGKISFQVTPHFVQVEDNGMQMGAINLGMLV